MLKVLDSEHDISWYMLNLKFVVNLLSSSATDSLFSVTPYSFGKLFSVYCLLVFSFKLTDK